ncbi:MAG TPA: DUF4340 domain-containing protein [Thermoanaerobaculia bacterium]|nr:DUF4340 domain-containing protein [Thermoanaerobaculia bacterium]
MKPRTLLALLLVVAGLGAFIWFYERELPSSTERAALAKKVFRVEEEDVRAVELEWQGRSVRLERVPEPEKKKAAEEKEEDGEEGEDDGEADAEEPELEEPVVEERWRIARPRFDGEVVEADPAAVARLLEALLALEKARTLEEVKPGDVGLAKPRGRIRLETEEGTKELAIGAAVPTGAKVVVGPPGEEEAYVVDDTVLTDLQRPPAEWRGREMFPGERADVQRIALRASPGAPPVVLVKEGEDFRLAQPAADRADRDLADGLLSDLTNLRAESFLERGRAAEYGLAPPRGVVEVTFTGGTPPARIQLGTTGPGGLTATRIGRQVFAARNDLDDAVAREPRAWRSHVWSGLEVFEVDRARFTDPAGTVEVVRADTDWKRGKDLISFTAVSDLLFAALGAKADRLLTVEEARAAGIALDRAVLTIVLSGGPPKGETLTLYPPTAEGLVPARASGRDVVLLLPADSAHQARDRLADLRKAEPLPPAETAPPPATP